MPQAYFRNFQLKNGFQGRANSWRFLYNRLKKLIN